MIGALAALVVSASPGAPLDVFAHDALAAKKKKPAKKEEKKKEEAPAETSPGLDLTAPAQPEPAPEPPPSDNPPAKEEVKAEEPAKGSAGPFSVVTPHTVGESANVLEAAVGWPGIYVGYWRGILSALDVGARVGFNWGYEGQITRPLPGLRVQLAARYLFLEKDKLSVGVTFMPGVLVYFFARPAAGLVLPVAAVAGYALMDKLNVSATLEIPFWVNFGIGAVLPFLLGVGGEYFLNDSLALQAKLKGGVAVWLNGAGPAGELEAFVGAAYKL